MIEVKNLVKYYSSFKALDNINFTVNQGQIVGLLGLNGPGKTTLLKILGTLQLPSSGQVLIDGVDVEQDPYKARSLIGYLADVPALYKEMKVESYLRFVARLKDVAKSDEDSYVKEAMEVTNITGVASKRLAQLSHGFKQRVGVAQAIICKPKLLILDEPTRGIDVGAKYEIYSLMNDMVEQGMSIIMISSELPEVMGMSDRIYIMSEGEITGELSAEEATEEKVMKMAINSSSEED